MTNIISELAQTIEQLASRVRRLEKLVTRSRTAACRVYNDAAFTVGDSAWTAITFNSERSDTTGMHSTVTNPSRITFAIDGWYICGGAIYWAANATGMRQLSIRQGGSTFLGVVTNISSSVTYATHQCTNILHYFTVGEYVELAVYQTSGGNLDIPSGSSYSPEFWAILLLDRE